MVHEVVLAVAGCTVPALHVLQDEAAALGPYLPVAHARQAEDKVLPVDGLYRPAAHERQSLEVVLPVPVRYLPVPHTMQLPCLLPDWYCPGSQLLQAEK